MYLSPIQKGIQSAHCITDMIVKYNKQFNDFVPESTSAKFDFLIKWMESDKTMIVLNGGGSSELKSLNTMCMDARNACVYPFSTFYEEPVALGVENYGALTCFGILLPEKIYIGASKLRKKFIPQHTGLAKFFHEKELSLYDELNSFKTMTIPMEGMQPVQYSYNDWEIKFMKKLNKYSLA